MAGRTKKTNELTRLVFTLFELHGLLFEHGHRITKPFGQTPARWQVLGAIVDEPLTVSQIARRVGNARQSLQRVANILHKEDLVEFSMNPDHQRSPKVELTKKGRKLITKINNKQEKWSDEIVRQLKLSDLKTAIATAERIIEVLSNFDEDAIK